MHDNQMEPREAINIIKRMYKETPTTDQIIALDMAYAALGKQIPEEVTDIHVDDYICPVCGAENCTSDYRIVPKHCIECGQALYQRH